MKNNLFKLCLYIFAALCFVACSDEQAEESNESRSIGLSIEEQANIEAINQFSISLLKENTLQNGMEKNVVISPLGVAMTLGMIANALDASALEEVEQAFGSDFDLAEINNLSRKLMRELPILDKKSQLNLANSTWVNTLKEIRLPDEYVKVLTEDYSSNVEQRDFSSPSTLNDINEWGSKNANAMGNKILDVLSPGWSAIWINVLSFKGEWTRKFDKSQTRELPFYTADGRTISTPMMKTKQEMRIMADDVCTTVSIPFGNQSFLFTIILPSETTTLSDFIGNFSGEEFARIQEMMSCFENSLTMPKLKIGAATDVVPLLRSMGINTMFDRACFDKIMGYESNVGFFKQSVTFEADEDGAKAKVITYGRDEDLCNPSAPIVVDRPFIFMINERSTGAILVAGSIQQP